MLKLAMKIYQNRAIEARVMPELIGLARKLRDEQQVGSLGLERMKSPFMAHLQAAKAQGE